MPPDLRHHAMGDHLDRLYRAAWALCGSREDAEDLVQETYARVLAKPRRLAAQEDELPYLLRVLRNTFIDAHRARARRPRPVPLGIEEEDRVSGPRSASPVEAVAARAVIGAVAALPDEFRDVLVAVDVVGLSYAEAATALKIPQGTVMSRLYRGRARIAAQLEG